MSAALARVASQAGLSPLLVELEGRSPVATLFGHAGPLAYEEVELTSPGAAGAGAVRGRTLTPDDALVEYLDDHGMRRISKRLTRAGLVDVIATAVPGIKDILVLGKVKQLERDRVADVIIVAAKFSRTSSWKRTGGGDSRRVVDTSHRRSIPAAVVNSVWSPRMASRIKRS